MGVEVMTMVKEQVPLELSFILSFAVILEPPALLLLVNYKRQPLLSMKVSQIIFASR